VDAEGEEGWDDWPFMAVYKCGDNAVQKVPGCKRLITLMSCGFYRGGTQARFQITRDYGFIPDKHFILMALTGIFRYQFYS